MGAGASNKRRKGRNSGGIAPNPRHINTIKPPYEPELNYSPEKSLRSETLVQSPVPSANRQAYSGPTSKLSEHNIERKHRKKDGTERISLNEFHDDNLREDDHNYLDDESNKDIDSALLSFPNEENSRENHVTPLPVNDTAINITVSTSSSPSKPTGDQTLNNEHRANSHSVSAPRTPSNQIPCECIYCQHCQQLKNQAKLKALGLKWIIDTPTGNTVSIDMDNYDDDAIRDKKMLKKDNYPPCLATQRDDDDKEKHYYTQTSVARTEPRMTPVYTPFPEYHSIRRREQRLHKPYTRPLFVD